MDVGRTFGACLDDSESREFVGDPVVHQQVKVFWDCDDPLARNEVQHRMEEDPSCGSKPQVRARLDSQVGLPAVGIADQVQVQSVVMET